MDFFPKVKLSGNTNIHFKTNDALLTPVLSNEQAGNAKATGKVTIDSNGNILAVDESLSNAMSRETLEELIKKLPPSHTNEPSREIAISYSNHNVNKN